MKRTKKKGFLTTIGWLLLCLGIGTLGGVFYVMIKNGGVVYGDVGTYVMGATYRAAAEIVIGVILMIVSHVRRTSDQIGSLEAPIDSDTANVCPNCRANLTADCKVCPKCKTELHR